MVKKGSKKWPKMTYFWSFLGHFCHVLPSKLGNLGTPKSDPKWPKMTYFGSFLTTFLTTLFVCVLFELQLRAYLGGTWKEGQKGVQKWVISGVPRSAEPPKVDILASKHQIWHFGVSKNDPFLAKKWSKNGSFFGPFFCHFWPLFTLKGHI